MCYPHRNQQSSSFKIGQSASPYRDILERSSKVSLLTCHACVVDVDKSRDFPLFSNKLSVLNPSTILGES